VNSAVCADEETLKEILAFQATRAVIKSLKVVNDAAFMSIFNQSITKMDSQMQKII